MRALRWCKTGCLFFLAAAICAAVAGCKPHIEDHYGSRTGPAAESVNGTSVFGDMFAKAGHRVSSHTALSPRLWKRAECIVWFPNDTQPPTDEVRWWLADWLRGAPGRTLIYVGRDFDAYPFFWKKIGKPVPPRGFHVLGDLTVKKASERGKDEKEPKKAASKPAKIIPLEDLDEDDVDVTEAYPYVGDGARVFAAPWFTVDPADEPRVVGTLSGAAGWLEDIDAGKVEIQLKNRLLPAQGAAVLLASEGDALVSRLAEQESQLLLVPNGSFLLNVPLVNHEHRKLAGKLIEVIGPPKQNVVFLESGPGGPPIRDEDPTGKPPSALAVLTVHPYVWISIHFAVAGVLYCFACWPIFGVPRELPRPAVSDFGKHIQAMADLLRRSRDRAFARGRLLNYRQRIEEK